MVTILGWEWYYTPFTPLLLAASLLIGVIAVYAWRNRDAAGASAFTVMMAAGSLWAFAYALQLAGATEATKVFWANLVHVGVAVVPIAWFCFTLQFTGRAHWLTRRTVVVLSLVPAIYVLLVFTNEYHLLVRDPLGVEPSRGGSLLIFRQSFGPVFWVHAAYGYALMVGGVIVLTHLLFWSPRVYRRQTAILLFGAILSMITNTIHHAGFSPVQNFDLTPFSFPLIGVAYLVAIYQYRLLDLTPVAREFVVDTLQDGVVVTDRNGRVVDLNAPAEHLLDLSKKDVIGRELSTQSPIDASLVDRPADDGRLEDEIVLERDAERRHLHLVSSPVFDVRNDPLGRSIVVRDVTAERELEAEVDATLERLRRSNAELEAFTSVASHDLREPLRTTENYLELLERSAGDTLDDEQREFVSVARENSERMQGMITDLLRYSRIDASRDEFEPVDCDRVLETVLETLQFDIEDRGATVTVEELPTVWGVEHLLRRLFQNLLANALKYTDASPDIHVFATRVGEHWDITVRDDGVGMTAGEAERVFDLFTRADRTGARPGSGMGLAICKKIVEHHGGDIRVDSTLDVGTDVVVRLPVPTGGDERR